MVVVTFFTSYVSYFKLPDTIRKFSAPWDCRNSFADLLDHPAAFKGWTIYIYIYYRRSCSWFLDISPFSPLLQSLNTWGSDILKYLGRDLWGSSKKWLLPKWGYQVGPKLRQLRHYNPNKNTYHVFRMWWEFDAPCRGEPNAFLRHQWDMVSFLNVEGNHPGIWFEIPWIHEKWDLFDIFSGVVNCDHSARCITIYLVELHLNWYIAI